MGRKCAVCGRDAPQRCGGCSKVSYSSREHQKQDWKTHKNDCAFFRIEDTLKMGKGFVATRNIEPGRVIWEETPVAVAPVWGDKALLSEPCCVGCGWVMDEKGRRRVCSKCKWPACSQECEKDPAHAYECQLFSSKSSKFPPVKSPLKEMAYSKMFIMSTRVILLKRKDVKVYEQVLQLQFESSIPAKCISELVQGIHGSSELMDEHVGWLKTLGLEITVAELSKVYRIVQINNYYSQWMSAAWIDNTDINSRTIVSLYLTSSRMNNSCVPNCSFKISHKPECKIRVWTTTEVKKGHELTICYDARQCEVGTRQRQRKFQQCTGFICECPRCTDPTELGTFMSGVVCPDCYSLDKQDPGYFLPQSPSDLNKTALWECTGCRRTTVLSDLFPVEVLAEEIAKMFTAAQDKRISYPKLVAFCEDLMVKYQGKVLHPNHWVIQDAARAMLNLAWRDIYSLDVPTYERLIQLGEYLLEIQDKVSPGTSTARAFLQYTIAFCLSNLATKLMAQGDFQMAIRHFENALQFHKKIIDYSRIDFPGVDGKDFKTAQENMRRDLLTMQDCKMIIELTTMGQPRS